MLGSLVGAGAGLGAAAYIDQRVEVDRIQANECVVKLPEVGRKDVDIPLECRHFSAMLALSDTVIINLSEQRILSTDPVPRYNLMSREEFTQQTDHDFSKREKAAAETAVVFMALGAVAGAAMGLAVTVNRE